jgi:ATP-dependent RNA helicase DDX31/DBP7
VKSPTGSGKTLAYAVPILNILQGLQPAITRADGLYALVILPTRELVLQTYNVVNKLCRAHVRIVPGMLMGGEKKKSEKARLRKGVNILIGTPGKLVVLFFFRW